MDGIGRRQYCSQSVIVAKDGSLIWYNDAGRIYCYENAANMEPGIFRDTKNHWAKDQIALLAGEDILNGTGDGYFSPETKVTPFPVCADAFQILRRRLFCIYN